MTRIASVFAVFAVLAAFAFLVPFTIAACGGQSAGGMPEDCEVRYDGQCYMTSAAACAAASCPIERCLILESYPGQVECQAEAAADPVEGAEDPVTSSAGGGEGDPCDATRRCAQGLFCDGAQGCDTSWKCQPMRACTRDLVTYCGCDGAMFQNSGSCPGRPYAHRGLCEP
ncbi:MAG: hypothetical protein JRH11_05810 [Deltaproteobacteria bacterium]|nr:hypothetical protein [Deltaproteobacteria bacterium]